MRTLSRRHFAWMVAVEVLATPMLLPLAGGDNSKPGRADDPSETPEATRVIDSIIAGEKQYQAKLPEYTPRVETYIQYYQRDTILGEVPKKDAYFLGRLKVTENAKEISFIRDTLLDWLRHRVEMFEERPHLNEFAVEPLVVDQNNFDREHYVFKPVRREQLGDLQCLVIDVHPRRPTEGRPFEGRIWVENHTYAIVRLNGVRLNHPREDLYVHFDCWRENLRPGVWLPVYIFSQDSDYGSEEGYKAETRLWGYEVSEWRKLQNRVETNNTKSILHRKKSAPGVSADESLRLLKIEAEHNVLKRLERAGLIAPPGPIDNVLETVVHNLVITNHLDKLPPIQCRVLLTSSLESFSLAYVIVVSRGLIDVLPDEPSLAAILAHELAHVTLGRRLNSNYARSNGLDVPDEKLLSSLDLAGSRRDEEAADAQATEYLKNSPYNDKLGRAGLFLEAASSAAKHSPHLFGAHLGNGLTEGHDKIIRMAALTTGAPALVPKNVDQIAALPLGSRVQVNAWDGSIAFTQRKAAPVISASDKLPFQVTPVIPYLKFYAEPPKVAVTSQK